MSVPSRFRRRTAVALIAASLAALSPTAAVAATPPGPRPDTGLHQQLEDLVDAPGGPPGVIAVLRDGRNSRVLKAGVADVDTGRRPAPHDHMRIASTAKAFSGAVALSLVDWNTLDLDDTLGERLPHLPKAWHAVTLRRCCTTPAACPTTRRAPGS